MIAGAARQETANPPILLPSLNPKTVSWEAFQRKYLTKEDAYKYEWAASDVFKVAV